LRITPTNKDTKSHSLLQQPNTANYAVTLPIIG